MPSVATMQQWVQSGRSLKHELDKIDGRLYPVLRWVLSSMRGHLRFIDKAEDRIPQLQHMKQFVMHCSKPETEAKFQKLAEDATIKLAFHGSPIQNWHSIVRRGLNFSKTSHGRSFGNGIYLATNALTSLGYMGGGGKGRGGAGPAVGTNSTIPLGWAANSIFAAKFQCLAVCEGLVLPDICCHLVASNLSAIAPDTVLIDRG
jgi:hypothetical protein